MRWGIKVSTAETVRLADTISWADHYSQVQVWACLLCYDTSTTGLRPFPHIPSVLLPFIFPPSPSYQWAWRHTPEQFLSPVWIIMSYSGGHNPDLQLIRALSSASGNGEEALQEKERPLLWCQPGSHISVKSLLTYTHLCRLYGGIQEAFPADRHKRGLGSEWRSKVEKKKKEKKALPHPPPPLLIPRSLSSPITHKATLSPWPLYCCAVPTGFQGAANGLRLIYMQLGWDICRPSSPPIALPRTQD